MPTPYREKGGNPHVHYQRNLHRANWPCETDLMMEVTITWSETDDNDTHRRYFGKLWKNGLPIELPVAFAAGEVRSTTTTGGSTTAEGGYTYGTTITLLAYYYQSWRWGYGNVAINSNENLAGTAIGAKNDDLCISGGFCFRHKGSIYIFDIDTPSSPSPLFTFGVWGIQESGTWPNYFSALEVKGDSATNQTNDASLQQSLPNPDTFIDITSANTGAHVNSLVISDGATVSWSPVDPSDEEWIPV